MKLKIFGREYRVEGGEVSPDYMKRVAEYVDSKISALSNSSQILRYAQNDREGIAILAALNIADELFQEHELNEQGKASVERTIALLEEGLS
ncbi:MAG: cell division protein ZapA [bacterium]|nr:cell division protein ZapA [bacterium]